MLNYQRVPSHSPGQARQAPRKAWDRSRRTAALTAAATALGLGVGVRGVRARQAAGGAGLPGVSGVICLVLLDTLK